MNTGSGDPFPPRLGLTTYASAVIDVLDGKDFSASTGGELRKADDDVAVLRVKPQRQTSKSALIEVVDRPPARNASI